jgi:hypothetical protein
VLVGRKEIPLQRLTRYLDPWSIVLLAITLVLFIVAMFVKGLTHDLLLEAGIFLVSLKLITMAYRNNLQTTKLEQKLQSIQSILERVESSIENKIILLS